ncbi:MAG: hypothetical protein ACRD18_13000 [Terriglobia bacterium]
MKPNDQKLLLRYLLGELKADEAAKLDERLIADDELLDRMEEAQNDLLDAYAGGKLSPEQRERVEKALLHSSGQLERLRMARSLEARQPIAAAPRAVPESRARSGAWRLGLGLACVAAVIAFAVFLGRGRFRHGGRIGIGNEPASVASNPAAKMPAPASSSPPAGESTSAVPMPQKAPFVLLLGAGVMRGDGALANVTLPRGLKTLEVQVLISSHETASHYDVRVLSAKGNLIRTLSGLTPKEILSQRLLQFQIPVSDLPTGIYDFRVFRIGAGSNLAASYRARLRRQDC